jgi:TadE-like protein
MTRTPVTRFARGGRARRGATTVETAIVLSIVFLFIFGILEYCRFLFFLEMAENAAREGARYAICNTSRSVSVGAMTDTATIYETTLPSGAKKYYVFDDALGPATPPTIRGVVNCFMKGRQGDVTGYNVDVYSADANGANIGPWDSAAFGGDICVRITGQYQFMTAKLLGFTGKVPINIRIMMNSEGN